MKNYALIGYPLGHSFSEKYFTQKFKKEGLQNSKYELKPLKNIKEFPKLLKDNPKLVGLNVTIPYKQEVIPFLNELDSIAKEIGAVNTIKISKGNLKGYNTDVIGFENSLMKFLNGNKIKKALVFGTGGASKAIIYALNKMNIEVQLVSRTKTNGVLDYNDLQKLDLSQFKLLVNTTPLGTFPNTEDCVDIPYDQLTSKHYLYDLVYNPEMTLFMKKGKENGAQIINGLEMLIGQAEAAWEIWNTLYVKYDDLDFQEDVDPDIDQLAFYNDILFSGIAYENNKDFYFEMAYHNGVEHGRSFGMNLKSNEMIFEEFYVDGLENGNYYKMHVKYVVKRFYQMGMLKTEHIFSLNGILLREYDAENGIDKEYYDNGNLYLDKNLKENNILECFYLESNGQWVVKVMGIDSSLKRNVFDVNVDLIIDHLDELNAQFHGNMLVWVSQYLLKTDHEKLFILLTRMSVHSDDYLVGEAAYYFGELGDKRGIPLLKKLLSNQSKVLIHNRFDFGSHGNSFTVSQRAEMSIRKIRKNNSFWKSIFG